MEFLGIGPSELFFIILIAIIILGPKDMQKAGKSLGRWLNQFIRSDSYKALQRASREIRNLPTTLMREANVEELQSLEKDIRQSIDPRPRTSTFTPNRSTPPSNPPEPSLEPPTVSNDSTDETSAPQEPEQP